MNMCDFNVFVSFCTFHLNDDTLAGIRLKKFPVFSVQYHPEASAGPHDSRYLFDQFIQQLEKSTAHNLKTAQA